jgi:hypothetical protein
MGREKMDHARLLKRRASPALIALALICGGVSAARAQMPGYNGNDQSERVWKRMDNCKRQAWKQHPDYTREGSLKRDEVVRHCLEANNEPPVSPLTQPAQPERSGSSR